MANETNKPENRTKWEGDSRETMHEWPKPPRANIGGDLTRLQKHEDPLDSKHLDDGIYELRDRHKNVWYRLLYWLNSGWIYVLHCFEKKTNKTPPSDLKLAKDRRSAVLRRNDPPYVPQEEVDNGEEEASA